MNEPAPSTSHRLRDRATVRLRLTALVGMLFLSAGAVLLALNYVLVERALTNNRDEVRTAVALRLGLSEGQLRDLLAGSRPEGSLLPDSTIGSERAVFRAVQRDVTRSHLDQLVGRSAIALGFMAIVSVGLGWLVAGRVLRPVHDMTATARRLSESNLHERIDLHGPSDELKALADTFDAMLDRLEAAFESQQRFVADASHELRTPLSIMRTEVDVALADANATPEELRAMGETVRDATIRSERLIDSLLTLARSDAATPADDLCDLALLARTAVDRVAPEADGRRLGLELDVEPAVVVGDRSLLDRLVGNLVENAVRYNSDGGWLSVQTRREGDAAVLRVANSGARVEPSELGRLTRRFYGARRGPVPEQRSFGLGLSIVEQVARAHGGSLELVARDEGGLEATVHLPASTRTIDAVSSVADDGPSTRHV